MSRYIELTTSLKRQPELVAALAELGLVADVGSAARPILLEGSLECAGAPVEIRLRAASLGTTQDAGFRATSRGYVLVCGDLDRPQVERLLLAPLEAQALKAQLGASSRAAVETTQEADGTTRIVIRGGSDSNS